MSAFYNVDQPPFNSRSSARAIAAANNGLLFDPSDMSTMFQNAAGTTPVTAVEQPVGKILDKSGNGNHATQSVTASRPTLSARKNVLLATETLATQSVTTIAAQYTLSFTGAGAVTLSGSATGTLTGTGAANRVSLTVTPTAGTLTLTVSGSVTKAQLELGAVAGPYQRVNASTDYDTNPALFPKYLKFDGVDDYFVIPGLNILGNFYVAAAVQYSGTAEHVIDSFGAAGIRAGLRRSSKQLSVVDALATYSSFDIDDGLQIDSAIFRNNNSDLFKNTKLVQNFGTFLRNGTITSANIGCNHNVTGGYHNGRIYGLILLSKEPTDAQRVRCERFLARKAGVML